MVNKRKLGSEYEQRVARYLERYGFQILQMNYRCRCGEIDLVARDGVYLVFVEVKYRSSLQYGEPWEAVDVRKQRTIRLVANQYMREHHVTETTPVRFDVASVVQNKITYFKNAYETW